MYIIPLATEPNQQFYCTIPIDGENRRLSFELRYNAVAAYWSLTVTDGISGKTLIDAIPLMRGEYPAANLLEQYAYMKIGSAVIVPQGELPADANPDDTNLGAEFYLVWGDTLG
jgi:hypothetical protein